MGKLTSVFCVSLALVLSILSINCKKDATNDSYNPPTPSNPPVSNTDSVLNKNVRVIDSTKLILNSDSTLLASGKYEYTFSGSAPELKINDIIVGATNGGYIRKILSVNKQSTKITLETSQGNMEDVFNNVRFNLKTGLDSLRPARILSGGYQFDVSGQTLYQDGSLTIKLDKGVITADGDWNFGFDFKNAKLNTFEMGCKNATFNGEFNLNISASQVTTIAEKTSVLARVAKYNTFLVGAVPVVLYTEVELRCVFSATIKASSQGNYLVNTTNTANVGINYQNAQWQNNFTNDSKTTLSVINQTSNAGAQIKMGIVPYISFRLYEVLGPYFSLGLQEEIEGNVAVPSIDWDFTTTAWIQAVGGLRANIVGSSLFDYNKEWNSDKLFYKTPFSINKIAGDNQTGAADQYLSQPIKVRVLDNNNNPQSNVSVNYSVTAGGGSVQIAAVLTDKDGYAEVLWKLGSQFGIQTVSASVKKADGSTIQNVPIEFAAAIGQTLPTLTTATPSSITQTTAVSGGNIINDGGSPVSARGVCWSTTANPTIANNKTTDGTGTGSFTSNISGLTANTTYYVRAYASNNSGTSYSSQASFITLQGGVSGVTVAGENGPGSAANQLFVPTDVVLDISGNLIINDSRNNRVQKWITSSAVGITIAGGNGSGSSNNQFGALSFFVSPNGDIYIPDGNRHRVMKWTPGAISGIVVAGGNGAGSGSKQLYSPNAVFVDNLGNLFISDYTNNRIQMWKVGIDSGITVAGGNGPGSAPNQLHYPHDIFVTNGNMYISDSENNRVQKWTIGASSGITVAGGNGAGSASNQLTPWGIYVDSNNNIYVADNRNHRVQKWKSGAVSGTTVAGGNGQGSAANQLNVPSGVFVDAIGNIYIADSDNSRIQKWTQ